MTEYYQYKWDEKFFLITYGLDEDECINQKDKVGDKPQGMCKHTSRFPRFGNIGSMNKIQRYATYKL